MNATDLDHVGISFNPRANMGKRVGFVLKNRPSLGAIIDRLKRQGKTLALEDQFAEAVGLTKEPVTAKFHRIEHHQTHVAAGFLISPYEESSVLSVDGMGDFTSTLTAQGKGTDWREFDPGARIRLNSSEFSYRRGFARRSTVRVLLLARFACDPLVGQLPRSSGRLRPGLYSARS